MCPETLFGGHSLIKSLPWREGRTYICNVSVLIRFHRMAEGVMIWGEPRLIRWDSKDGFVPLVTQEKVKKYAFVVLEKAAALVPWATRGERAAIVQWGSENLGHPATGEGTQAQTAQKRAWGHCTAKILTAAHLTPLWRARCTCLDFSTETAE